MKMRWNGFITAATVGCHGRIEQRSSWCVEKRQCRHDPDDNKARRVQMCGSTGIVTGEVNSETWGSKGWKWKKEGRRKTCKPSKVGAPLPT